MSTRKQEPIEAPSREPGSDDEPIVVRNDLPPEPSPVAAPPAVALTAPQAGRAAQRVSLLSKLAEKYSIEPATMLSTLKATAFRGDVTNEQMVALCVVALQYNLNPWTREIYAFPDKRRGGIVPVVGVDGWARIVNEHPMFDGMDFEFGPIGEDSLPEWAACVIHRKDRAHPVRVVEYMTECKRGDDTPWASHPRRMLRHKAMIQAARLAFGFAGIFDPDEATNVIEGEASRTADATSVAAINARIAQRMG